MPPPCLRYILLSIKKIMKHLIILFVTTVITSQAWGQISEPVPPSPVEPVAPVMELPKEDEIFVYTEESPIYPGGIEGLQNFLFSKIKYPQEAVDANIQGRVFVSFVVERDGSVSNAVVKRGINGWSSLDKEAIRVVRLLHYDRPAYQNGKPVRCEQILPITFKLN
jgi:periplasmic protein TonB